MLSLELAYDFSFKKHSLCSSSHQRSEVQAVYPAKWYTSCGGRTQLWCKNWWSPLHSRCVCNICAFLKRKWFFLNLHTYIYLLNFNFFFHTDAVSGGGSAPILKIVTKYLFLPEKYQILLGTKNSFFILTEKKTFLNWNSLQPCLFRGNPKLVSIY